MRAKKRMASPMARVRRLLRMASMRETLFWVKCMAKAL